MRRELAQRRILLSGASSGIGRALALELARHGTRLLLTARREELLRALAEQVRQQGAEADFLAGDITEATTRQALIERANAIWGGLDVLINNAGAGAFGRFRDAGPERLRAIFELNFFALTEMTRAALPLLVVGRQPLLVNVSSILGHRGIPHSSEYCASKFAVQGFSEALRAELKPAGVNLLVVSPGTTETEFFLNVLENHETPWFKSRGVPAARVAEATVRAMRSGRHEIIPSASGRMLVWLNRFAPRLADKLMERYG